MLRENLSSGFLTSSDTIQAERPQKIARGLESIGVVLSSEKKKNVPINCAVTVQLIRVFVFAYAKSRFSHDAAHIMYQPIYIKTKCIRVGS